MADGLALLDEVKKRADLPKKGESEVAEAELYNGELGRPATREAAP